MFRFRLATSAAFRKKAQPPPSKTTKKSRKRRAVKDSKVINGCVGLPIRLGERELIDHRPIRQGCSSRCRHTNHLKETILSSGQNKADEWISEDIYKHFTETDSRPLTPENYTRRSVTLPRSSSVVLEKARKCVTPEPDAKQCQFHSRRVLILDLRRVKSVDAITRQNSLTTGESVDSTYGDYDYDNRSSSVNRDSSSIFHHSTPRNFSVSRSNSPKGTGSKFKGRGLKKPKERSGSPIAYERSSSPKILEGLTLPPLHQSVLTLLGQKSGVKPSPRSHLKPEISSPVDASSGNKGKKLRRHGRKKKAKEDGKESEEKEIEKSDVRDLQHEGEDHEELQETQLSTFQNQGDQELEAQIEAETNIRTPTHLRELKSLRDVLDEHLGKQRWNPKEIENLNDEIQKLSNGLQKYQTDFKTKSISMNEDAWLGFPRTWTRSTATFGAPSNYKLLLDLTPAEYLRNYVTITEPRLHLYGLIYQRYRILENPTGTFITVKSLQRAITEVLGRQFTDKEMAELQNSYLIVDSTFVLDTKTFAGICAFCERIYGTYALENCNECIVCESKKLHDKERCHVARKNELEEMDLLYLAKKIKYGEATTGIARLIGALTEHSVEHK